ncbi:MAG: hypothetical protein RLN86_10260 [Cyclobacteriaceae bacterium]
MYSVSNVAVNRFFAISFSLTLVVAVGCGGGESQQVNSSTTVDYMQMVEDSIWYKVYRHYHNTFVRPASSYSIGAVSESEKMDPRTVGFFNFLFQNFDLSRFSSEDFLVRYPFAKQESIEISIRQLVTTGLLMHSHTGYSITEYGSKVGAALLDSRMNDHALDSLLGSGNHMDLIHLFEEVSRNALSENYPGMNTALQRRREVSPRDASKSTLLRLELALGDLVALRNDQSHYRLELLKKIDSAYVKYGLSFAAVEIMSYAYDKNFNPAQVISRPTWGHTIEETIGFMDELVNKDLAKWEADEISLTPKGKALQLRSAEYCEQLFYAAWLPMRSENYNKLTSTIK